MTEETELERLSRECREMYDELALKGLITGTYAEWMEASAKQAAKKLEPSMVIVPGDSH